MNRLKCAAVALAVLAAAPRAAIAQNATPTPAPTAAAAGNWDLVVNMPQGSTVIMMTLEQTGDKITGKLASPQSPQALTGEVAGRDLEVRGALVFLDGNLDLDFDGFVSGDSWNGTLKFGVLGEFPFAGKREPAAKDEAPAADPPDAPAVVPSTPAAAGISGKWNVVISVAGVGDFPMAATLAQEGTRVTGTFFSPMGQVPVSGTMTGDSLALDFTATTPQGSYTLSMTGQLGADGLVGKASVGGLGEADWTAARAQP